MFFWLPTTPRSKSLNFRHLSRVHQRLATRPWVCQSTGTPPQWRWSSFLVQTQWTFRRHTFATGPPADTTGVWFLPSTVCFHSNANDIWVFSLLPVVPHKAVAEVSEEETYRRGWLLWITDGRAMPLIDRKMVGFVIVGVVAMVAVVTSSTTAGLSVVYCSCSRSCSVVEL